MKKKYFIILFFSIACATITFSQPCLTGGITFSTQADINNFQINYPNCTEIEGNVSISGDNITNLAGLGNLVKIDGELSIYSNDSLINLSGLNGLKHIGENLTLSVNPLLANLLGLNGLISIGGSIYLNYTTLNDLSGLDSLVHIGGEIQFTLNHGLTSLTGLENVSSIGGNIFIYGNSNLQSITGLMSVKSINGHLVIEGNPLLTDLSGLDSINPGTITNLAIYNNSSLSTCAVTSICQYLLSPTGTVNISNNAVGCNSQEDVENACDILSLPQNDQPDNSISVFPNPCPGLLTLDIDSNDFSKATVAIYDYLGQIVFNKKLDSNTLDVSSLTRGIYYIILTMESRKYKDTFIVIK